MQLLSAEKFAVLTRVDLKCLAMWIRNATLITCLHTENVMNDGWGVEPKFSLLIAVAFDS